MLTANQRHITECLGQLRTARAARDEHEQHVLTMRLNWLLDRENRNHR